MVAFGGSGPGRPGRLPQSRAVRRDMQTLASPSSLVIFSTMLRRQTGSLYTEPHRKRNLVQAFEAAGFRNHESSDNSEEHLRSRERPPVNVFCEVRIHKSESAVQQAGPCNWRNDPAEQDRSSRPNRKQCAVKDAYEESGRALDDIGGDECAQTKMAHLLYGGIGPRPHACAAQQIYHVPNAVVADDAVDLCRNDHGQAA